MNFRSEVLAFAFGVLLILVTFGDDHLGRIAATAFFLFGKLSGRRFSSPVTP